MYWRSEIDREEYQQYTDFTDESPIFSGSGRAGERFLTGGKYAVCAKVARFD
jgi:hypothetical protein